MNLILSTLLLALAPPRVTQVVVFPDRAQVTRTTSVACGARAVARFDGIPPSADPASFRARSTVGTVEGLRSEEHTREALFGAELQKIDNDLHNLDLEERVLRDRVERIGVQTRVGQQYGNVAVSMVSREMSDGAPATKAWDVAFASGLDARVKNGVEAVELNGKLRELQHRRNDLNARRSRVAGRGERKEFAAEVLITCPAGRSADVELSYMVGGASWLPAYEARAEESGSGSGDGSVEFSTFATVRQTTGEDWSQARLILSTAVPRQDATPPEVGQLLVWSEERTDKKKVLVRREEVHEHAESGEKDRGDTGGAVRARAQGLSVQLVVPDASDVSGDGTPARVFVGRTKMPARFALRTAPKLMPFAFRVADLSNVAPWPLLPGTVDLFRKSGLVARYPLERIPEGGRFHLSFGAEESVRIKRVVLEEIERDKGFLNSTRRFKYGYRFEVASYLPKAQELELAEHIPVSELDDVKVEMDLTTTAGYALAADDGIATWKLTLKPGEQRTVELHFHVDAPSSYDTGAM